MFSRKNVDEFRLRLVIVSNDVIQVLLRARVQDRASNRFQAIKRASERFVHERSHPMCPHT